MKFKSVLLATLLITITSTVFARTGRDSIGVENNNGKKVILHKLDAKDNYYSLGRKYNVSPKAIIAFNNNAQLIIGNVVKVPTERPFLESSYNTPQQNKPAPPAVQQPQPVVQQPAPQQTAPQQNANQQQNSNSIDYKVSAGETLYSIAKRFSTSVADIQQINGLTSATLAPGQIIKVHQGEQSPQSAVANAADQSTVAKQDVTSTTPQVTAADSANASKFNANRYGLYEKDEKGVATWMDSTDLDPNKKLVLHRTAPIGTVIKITNPMTNLTTYAKVVGKFTDNEANKDVIIMVTKNVASSLGALDKRFRVTISYGSPNE